MTWHKWRLPFILLFTFLLFSGVLQSQEWHKGHYSNVGEEILTVKWRPDSRGVNHIIAMTEAGVLKHYVRGSQQPFPIDEYTIDDNILLHGNGDFFIKESSGNFNVSWPYKDGFIGYWANPLSFPDPSDPPADKTLSVENGKILYGEEEILLCGVSRREALWRTAEEYSWSGGGGWSAEYTFEDYQSDIEDSGINYVRHLGVMDTSFMEDHIRRMKIAGVIVEIEVYDAYSGSFGILVDIDSMGEISKTGNVFFDCGNEFLDYEPAIDIVIDLAERLKAQGCIVSAGAWSGPQGKQYSQMFHTRYSGHDIETHHREWTVESWQETMAYGKPVVFNEYFSQGNLSLQEVKFLMNSALETGCKGVTYYGFRFPGIPGLTIYDPFDYLDILNYAGKQGG